jgi:hypothetical protein
VKTYGEWRYRSTTLTLCTRWMSVASFTPRPVYPRGESSRNPLDRRLGGPQSRSGSCGVKKSFSPPGNRNLVVENVFSRIIWAADGYISYSNISTNIGLWSPSSDIPVLSFTWNDFPNVLVLLWLFGPSKHSNSSTSAVMRCSRWGSIADVVSRCEKLYSYHMLPVWPALCAVAMARWLPSSGTICCGTFHRRVSMNSILENSLNPW